MYHMSKLNNAVVLYIIQKCTQSVANMSVQSVREHASTVHLLSIKRYTIFVGECMCCALVSGFNSINS